MCDDTDHVIEFSVVTTMTYQVPPGTMSRPQAPGWWTLMYIILYV